MRPDSGELRLLEQRSVSSDEAALDTATLYLRYASYVAGIGHRLLGGRADEVDDLVQDVFLDAHRYLATVHSPAAVRGWLATITVRMARKRLRRRRFRTVLGIGDQEAELDDVVAPSASPEERDLLHAVYRELDRLPTDQRIAWVLRRLEGRELREVAELCDCSLATVKRRVAAAQGVLSTLVGEPTEPDGG